MAKPLDCVDLPYFNDGYFSSYLHQNELQDELLLSSLQDAEFAEELQFQEALKASLINCPMPSNVSKSSSSSSSSSSSPPLSVTEEVGESFLDFCEICTERKEGDPMIQNGSSVCFDCSFGLNLAHDVDEHAKDFADMHGNRIQQHHLNPNPKAWGNIDVEQNSGMLSHANSNTPVSRKGKEPQYSIGSGFDRGSSTDLSSIKSLENYKEKDTADVGKNFAAGNEFNSSATDEFYSVNPAPLQALEGPAQVLEVKLNSEETSTILAGEVRKWKAINAEKNDHEIVWPPMVVIRNTSYKNSENNKWCSMTSEELLDLFSSYDAIVKAQHAYNSHEHCGMSILIFECTATGYLEAERLHKQFAEQETGRDAWYDDPVYFLPGGEQQLYGYMAMKEDVDMFNRRLTGKSKVRYEMRSYQDMIVDRIRQMGEDNHQLIWLRNRVAEQERRANDLEECIHMMKERLHNAMMEIHTLRNKINPQQEQRKEEMNSQEEIFKERMEQVLRAREENGEGFENIKKQEEEGHENVEAELSRTEDYDYDLKIEETDESLKNKEKETNTTELTGKARRLIDWMIKRPAKQDHASRPLE